MGLFSAFSRKTSLSKNTSNSLKELDRSKDNMAHQQEQQQLETDSDHTKDHTDEATDEQMVGCKEVFDMFDVDGNGTISLEELRMVMDQLGHSLSLKELYLMVRAVDTRGDGEIDFEDFITLLQNGKLMSSCEKASTWRNKDEELRQAFERFEPNLYQPQQQTKSGECDTTSSDERTSCKEVFDMFDVDHNGSISLEELQQAMTQMGLSPSLKELYVMFRKVDAKGDGEIDFDEFIALLEGGNMGGACACNNTDEQKVLIKERGLRQSFNMFDLDQSGFIDKKELKQVMSICLQEELSDEDVTAIMNEVDKNGDGRISFEEFKGIMEE